MTEAGKYGPDNFIDPYGKPIKNTPFSVRQNDVLSTLYTDENRTALADNPGMSDALGNISFFAEPGYYDLTVGETTLSVAVDTIGGGGGGGGDRDSSQYLSSENISGTHTVQANDGTLVCIGATNITLPSVATIDPGGVGGHEYTVVVAGFFTVNLAPQSGTSLYGPTGGSVNPYVATSPTVLRLLQTAAGWTVTYDSALLMQEHDHGDLTGLTDVDHPSTAISVPTDTLSVIDPDLIYDNVYDHAIALGASAPLAAGVATSAAGYISTQPSTVQQALINSAQLIGPLLAASAIASSLAGAAIPGTVIDAKGDLIAGTADDTPARVAVGANGKVLTADSAEPTGLKWGDAPSDAITVPDGTMTFVEAYYPPASDDLTDHLVSIDDAFVGAAQAIVAVGAASIDNDQKGAPNGVAELDGSGLVLSSQLPSYVDDVIVVADYAALPGTGADGKIYVTSDTNLTYRWTGSAYTEISKSLALGTTSSTAYRGDYGAATAAGLADGSGVTDAAAFRGNLGLTYLATQPAIYRTDIATGAIDAALLDPTLAAEIAAAVPNTRTITAGTGLTGGGDLSADRTIAVDAATLARIGATVEAASDTAARTSTTAVADGVLEFTAAADTSYRIDAYLIFQGDATADLKIGFTIPAGTLHLTVEGALTTVASGSDYDRFLTLTSAATTVVGIAGASTPISVRVTGVIRPTSAGTVALIWAPNAAGAGTGVTRLARSQLYYRAA